MADSSQTQWTTLASTYAYSDEWVRLRSDTVQLPTAWC